MIIATIETVTDTNGQYGPEKISAVTMSDGGQTKVYTKPKASAIYNALAPGLAVELMPKNSGTGYLIKRIIPDLCDPPERVSSAGGFDVEAQINAFLVLLRFFRFPGSLHSAGVLDL